MADYESHPPRDGEGCPACQFVAAVTEMPCVNCCHAGGLTGINPSYFRPRASAYTADPGSMTYRLDDAPAPTPIYTYTAGRYIRFHDITPTPPTVLLNGITAEMPIDFTGLEMPGAIHLCRRLLQYMREKRWVAKEADDLGFFL